MVSCCPKRIATQTAPPSTSAIAVRTAITELLTRSAPAAFQDFAAAAARQESLIR
jgi:hypothetical protein